MLPVKRADGRNWAKAAVASTARMSDSAKSGHRAGLAIGREGTQKCAFDFAAPQAYDLKDIHGVLSPTGGALLG
jgi:hypothetical protein